MPGPTNASGGTNYMVRGVLALLGIAAIGGVLSFSSVSITDTGGDHKITIDTASNEASDRTLTIPALGGNDTIVVLGTAQTITGDKTFAGGANALTVGAPTTADATADTILAASLGTQTPLVIQGIAGQSAPLQEWQTSTGAVAAFIAFNGTTFTINSFISTNGRVILGEYIINGLALNNSSVVNWSPDADAATTADVGVKRSAAGVLEVNTGVAGTYADLHVKGALAAGTMTQANSALVRKTTHSFTWTNAQVVALGANLTGDITVCTLPAKTVVTNAYIVITGAATGPATLTVSLGRTSATYLDYLGNADAKAAANTTYGDAAGERGANLTGYDLPSYTATTDVKVHFIATVANLDQTVGGTGTVILETMLVP